MPIARFICINCGAISPIKLGKCPECEQWDSFIKEEAKPKKSKASNSSQAVFLADVLVKDEARLKTNINEFDRVLGGGFVAGSVVLLGGDPGIGKSTIALMLAGKIKKVLYISGEESIKQIRLRAERLEKHLFYFAEIEVLAETNLTEIENVINNKDYQLVIIDSIQSLFCDEVASFAGSISQIREATARLIKLAKTKMFPCLIIGHVTKDGVIAGPKVLEHMVDTVLYFEGERTKQFRIIRSFKNRFGSTNEIGIFEMQEQGLIEVLDPSAIFLDDNQSSVPGSVVFPAIEGSRPFLVEIQALVAESSNFNMPRRVFSGFDFNRIAIIIAVLEKKAHYKLSNKDIYLNVGGGLNVNEPACDLAVAMAIMSSLKNKAIAEKTVVFGEIGLSGAIRPVSRTDLRLKEVKKMGFKKAFLPKNSPDIEKIKNLDLVLFENIWQEY